MSNVLSEEKRQQVIALGRLMAVAAYLKAAGIGVRPPGAWGRRPPAKPANDVTTGFGVELSGPETKNCKPALLKDAMLRTLQAADIAGIRAFAVHAKGEEARRFYLQFDSIPSPTDPMHLFILLKDVGRIGGAG